MRSLENKNNTGGRMSLVLIMGLSGSLGSSSENLSASLITLVVTCEPYSPVGLHLKLLKRALTELPEIPLESSP